MTHQLSHPQLQLPHPVITEYLRAEINPGLYQGQDPDTFPAFLAHMQTVFKSENSPRNAIVQLMTDDDKLQAWLDDFGLKWERDPPFLFSQIAVLPRFKEHNRLQNSLFKLKTQIIEMSSGPEHDRIKEQLTKSTSGTTIEQIIEKKSALRVELSARYDVKYADQSYREYLNLKDHIQNYQDLWDQCNRELSDLNHVKGASLESKFTEIVEALGCTHGVLVNHWANVYWNDNLGEVDLVLEYTGGGAHGTQLVLIECKSRIHDIMAGWLQNGPLRAADKHQLDLDGAWRVIDRDTVPTYVVTTTPEHDFTLPMESLVKRIISYYVKHRCTPEECYQYARTILPETRMSPLEWYLSGGHEHVLFVD